MSGELETSPRHGTHVSQVVGVWTRADGGGVRRAHPGGRGWAFAPLGPGRVGRMRGAVALLFFFDALKRCARVPPELQTWPSLSGSVE